MGRPLGDVEEVGDDFGVPTAAREEGDSALKELTEALILAAVSRCLRKRVKDPDEEMLEVAAESILADVLEDGVPEDAAAARDRFESIMFSCELSPEEEDEDEEEAGEEEEDAGGGGDAGGGEDGEGNGGLYGDLRAAIARAMANEDDADDCLSRNQCEMCERVTPLTRHHLFPLSQHKHFQKRGFCPTGRSLFEVAAVCRPCHTAIHAFENEKELGEHYNTMEALLEVEQLAKFAQYQHKQKGRTTGEGHNNNLKYAK
eukprot:CAMPEP_0197614884 /NCGR_PEP_ID=MMETSP1326-20131121/59751_1 /TAXON_ID=1155430 /ORGANISM="Genus nov. species nov., Strain RCC2288" /LENGTH=258 /DNA_ID=CAMNT_0043183761 /DNA_START=107 /DNA_END=883 /DNA_ORIENTATION=-